MSRLLALRVTPTPESGLPVLAKQLVLRKPGQLADRDTSVRREQDTALPLLCGPPRAQGGWTLGLCTMFVCFVQPQSWIKTPTTVLYTRCVDNRWRRHPTRLGSGFMRAISSAFWCLTCLETSSSPCKVRNSDPHPALGLVATQRRGTDAKQSIWRHAEAKAWLSKDGAWWPNEVIIELCLGTKQGDPKLDNAHVLDTSRDVDVCLLGVQYQRQPTGGRATDQLKPADWARVVDLPYPEAVKALHDLDLPTKLTDEHVNVQSYKRLRKSYGDRFFVTLRDLRSQPSKRPATPDVVPVLPFEPCIVGGVRVVGLMPQWQPPAPSPHWPDWAGGRVVVHRAAFSPQQVSAATTLLRACTYNVLANQRDRKRLLSSRCDEDELLSALRTLARTLLPHDAAQSLEVPWAAFLLTMPECLRQRWHKDDRDPRVWSVIVALGSNPRVLMFRVGRREMPITIAPGDAVLFRGDVCHCGGASSKMCHCADPEARCNGVGSDIRVNLDCVELAVHAYVVTTRAGDGEFDMRHLGDEVPPCDGDSSD